MNPASTGQWMNFIFAKVAYVTLRGVVPYYYMSLSSVVSFVALFLSVILIVYSTDFLQLCC